MPGYPPHGMPHGMPGAPPGYGGDGRRSRSRSRSHSRRPGEGRPFGSGHGQNMSKHLSVAKALIECGFRSKSDFQQMVRNGNHISETYHIIWSLLCEELQFFFWKEKEKKERQEKSQE